jgi:Zn-finger nucleic acid-binding protein
MKCTSCKQGKLIPGYLDDLFPSHNCDNCGGNWVYLQDYLRWLEYASPIDIAEAESATISEDVQAQETKGAMLCPKTGTIMLKYRISLANEHRIDLSPSINGIWMDKGEWDLIKTEGLAGSLNKIFTAPWQRELKEKNATAVFSASYRNQFGDEKYQKIQEIKTWLDEQDDRNSLLAYLAARDPYSAIR